MNNNNFFKMGLDSISGEETDNIKEVPLDINSVNVSTLGEVPAIVVESDIARDKNSVHIKRFTQLIDKYEKDIHSIISESRNFYLVNAGRMNHGKSSLLNSLSGQLDDVFEVQDKRTTIKNKEYRYRDNVIFIDTPGLNADDSDDREAIKAYEKANVIVFVHNVSVGDIRKEEIRDLKTIASCFSSLEELSKHFVLVLTGKDSIQTKEDLIAIRTKIEMDIKKVIKFSNLTIFEVSNTTYRKGIREGKDKLVEHSGIPQLQKYLNQFIDANQMDVTVKSCEKIDLLTIKYTSQLEKQKLALINHLDREHLKHEKFLNKLLEILKQKKSSQSLIDNRIKNCKRQIEKLRESTKENHLFGNFGNFGNYK